MEYLNSQLQKLVDLLTPLLPLVNSHLVNYIAEDQWSNLLPINLRLELNDLQQEQINLIPTAKLYDQEDQITNGVSQHASLKQFLGKVRSLHADQMNILSSLSQVENLLIDKRKEEILNSAMSNKKAHEVSRMGQIIADSCKEKKISWVVDIGSGLGYLSSVLVVQHKMNVFALDSSSSNITNTLKRSRVIKNLWQQVDGKDKEATKQLKPTTEELKKNSLGCADDGVSFEAFEGKFLGLTKFVTTQDDLLDLVSTRVKSGQEHLIGDLGLVGLHTCGNLAPTSLKLFVSNPSVKFLCNVGCCYQLLEEEFVSDSLVINRQASGESEKECLDERYHSPLMDPFHRPGDSDCGFPLSEFLKEKKFCLGRNARDLASKPTHRLSTSDKNLRPLFWRALLEVVVRDLNGSWPKDEFVGRKVGRSCKRWSEYCKESLHNIGLSCEITDNQILDYYNQYESKEEELIKFYFLKASLAPVIENLINLDRLTFLHEQGFSDSHLVQIFDSVVSPRSTALIAFK